MNVLDKNNRFKDCSFNIKHFYQNIIHGGSKGMKYWKSIIILILTIFLFSIASVCASDANDTAIASEDTDGIIQASENQENGMQGSDDDEAVLSEDDSSDNSEKTVTNHTFKAIENAIESDCTIYLEPGIYKGDGQISIDGKSNIKIIGNSTTLDAQGKTGIFYIHGSSNIIIQNITFKNANSDSKGGAICINEAPNNHVNDCIFINNSAHSGGAIGVYEGSTYCGIYNCIFINNQAESVGGAIWWFGGSHEGRVSNCTFINNHANERGGAIRWSSSYNSRVNDCIFINNTDWGGYVIYANACDLNADYNWFGNNATNYNDSLPISDLVHCNYRLFLSASANPDTIVGSDTSSIIFKLCQYYSGEISDYDNAPFKNLDMTVTATKGNVTGTAKLGEPILFTSTGGGTASVTATVGNVRQSVEIQVKGDFDLLQDLVNNESLSLINLERNYTYNEFDTITKGVIINRALTINGNGYTLDAKGKSRIFYIEADNVTIKNLIIKNANATGDGGAIYFNEYGSVENCNFTNNTAKNSGGTIGFAIDGNVENCSFTDNRAGDWGGSIYFERTGSVTNCNFSNNTANALGGAVLFISAGNVTNCSFDDNTASNHGGAVYFSRDGEVTNCSFTNNNANSNGGGIYFAENSATSVMNSKFSNNTAANGGAIFNQRGHTTVDTCIFKTGNDTINSNVVILAPMLNVDNFTTTYNSGEKLTFDLKTNSSMPVNGNISISIYYKNNGAWMGNYSCLSGKGWTVILQAGSYYALFNTEYAGFEPINRTITVNKLKTQLTAKAVTATYNVNKYLVITLKDANGNPISGVKVSIKLGKSRTATTNKNGQVKVSTKGLAPKKYTAKITFNGNTNYVKSTKSVKVTIKKATPKLTAKKKTFKVKKAKKYTITLKTNKKKALKKGKVTLTVKVKGKKIKIIKKTNKKGKATFNLKKLNKKGKYTAVVKFAGNKYYKAKTVKAKITVR